MEKPINTAGARSRVPCRISIIICLHIIYYVNKGWAAKISPFSRISVPSVFYRLAVSDEREETRYPLHHSRFDLDEAAHAYGVVLFG